MLLKHKKLIRELTRVHKTGHKKTGFLHQSSACNVSSGMLKYTILYCMFFCLILYGIPAVSSTL